jgi:hypothetical protein
MKRLHNNEEGSVLVVALIMLVLLTILGLSITTTSEVEMQIAGNERIYKDNLYRAEAAALTGVQALADLTGARPNWIRPQHSATDQDIKTNGHAVWGFAQPVPVQGSAVSPSYVVVEQGVATFASLDMTRTTIREYAVYGRYLDNRGRAIVKVGFKRAE